ncbi:hypothetical protein [Vibrio genomosp. F10]|uniref:hypothetical protein n=1 Tax=Vibrio genomosp. F10 TaxID=723171 RepID=UPI0002F5ED90|nr:hypothetical protein [Vibrio genomosp. F10]OEF09456.1 hypothetical protein A1QK_05895 [Vibrio genomosp. F10 str. 9ZD137]
MSFHALSSSYLYSASFYHFSLADKELLALDIAPSLPTDMSERIRIVQSQLKELLHLAGQVVFDYQVADMPHKANMIMLYRGLVFVFVFRIGEREYKAEDIALAQEFAMALKKDHSLCADRYIVPVVIATEAGPKGCDIEVSPQRVMNTIVDNGNNLAALLEHFANQFKADEIEVIRWLEE